MLHMHVDSFRCAVLCKPIGVSNCKTGLKDKDYELTKTNDELRIPLFFFHLRSPVDLDR
jgi:hypothetical protein